MSFKVQMQMMGIFCLMPQQQMGTLEPSWGRKGERGREGGEGGRESECCSCREFCNFPIKLYLMAQSFFWGIYLIQTKEMKQIWQHQFWRKASLIYSPFFLLFMADYQHHEGNTVGYQKKAPGKKKKKKFKLLPTQKLLLFFHMHYVLGPSLFSFFFFSVLWCQKFCKFFFPKNLDCWIY